MLEYRCTTIIGSGENYVFLSKFTFSFCAGSSKGPYYRTTVIIFVYFFVFVFFFFTVGSDKPQRRGSVGSLDSGMSISFQSTTTSNASRENAAVVAVAVNSAAAKMRFVQAPSAVSGVYVSPCIQTFSNINIAQHQQSPINVIHNQQNLQQSLTTVGRITGRERKLSRSEESGRSTEV